MLVFNIVANNLNVIRNEGNDNVIPTLVDTGATLPVWVGDLDLFESYFPDCIEDDSETLISGFGKGIEVAPVYKIPKFEMRLGFPMLSKTNYGYVSYNEMHKPVSPSFYIEPFKDIYYIGTKRLLRGYQMKTKSVSQSSISSRICMCLLNNMAFSVKC